MSKMGGSIQRKLRSQIICERTLDDSNEGTSARTRPLSYDEIMLKRKNKKEFGSFGDKAREPEATRHVETGRNPNYRIREPNNDNQKRDTNGNHQRRDTNGDSRIISREYPQEIVPNRRVDRSSRTEHPHHKSATKEKRDMESGSKQKRDIDVRSHAIESNSHKEVRKSKVNEDLRGDVRYNNHEFKHRRDHVEHDKYRDRNVGPFERENKRKDRGGDDDKYRVRDGVKKHDSGSRRDSEILEKKKIESSRSRHDETRPKRRRSRSQERMKDKTRRSNSSSPKARKNASYHSHDHIEPSSRSEREKSRRHTDVDRSKMSGDGSSSNPRRHGVSSSGLGGYSPRKRKSEAAVKTPSPIRSPERKTIGSDKNLSSSVSSGTQLVSQTTPSNMIELASGFSVPSNMGKSISTIFSNNLSAFKQASIDSVQLTQATRPMRRLYIDNIPSSVTEKDVMECFNTFLLYSSSNQIRTSPPCISCMIHKEKGQALVEFLTPEDASTALSFDGRSLGGSILKIRRPKDYVEVRQVPSGTSEKPEAGGDSTSEVAVITDFVKDSPNKIFVGGIAEGLSSKMVMEIVGAFGKLKAYRFQVIEDIRESCAFLEFADPSITSKACAGLNGMKLGGRVLTVAQVFPDNELMESFRSLPFYGIPNHVKPLLQIPTEVLKLSNVLDHKAMDSLSETDLEEVLDDVRFECSRFGSVLSINVVRGGATHGPTLEPNEVPRDGETKMNPKEGAKYLKDGDVSNGEILPKIKVFDAVEGHNDELPPPATNLSVEAEPLETLDVEGSKETDVTSPPNSDALEKGEERENPSSKSSVFEVGSVLVEFKRAEASCMAAHCLHGRAFDDRVVSVEYVPLKSYREVFPK